MKELTDEQWNTLLQRQHDALQKEFAREVQHPLVNAMVQAVPERIIAEAQLRKGVEFDPSRDIPRHHPRHFVGPREAEEYTYNLEHLFREKVRALEHACGTMSYQLDQQEKRHAENSLSYAVLIERMVNGCRELGVDVNNAETPGELLARLFDYIKEKTNA